MRYRHKEKTQTVVTETSSWSRMYKVSFTNPEQGAPTAKFGVTEIVEKEGKRVMGGATQQLHEIDPNIVFPLLDKNGNEVGTMTGKELWKGIQSLYYHLDGEEI